MFTNELLSQKNILELTTICNNYKIKYNKKATETALIKNILDFIESGKKAAEILYYAVSKNNSNPKLLQELNIKNLPQKDHGDLNSLKINQLKDILDYYGVSKNGNKTELIVKINDIFTTDSKIQCKLIKKNIKLLILYNKYLLDVTGMCVDYNNLKEFITTKTLKKGFIYCIKLDSNTVKLGTSVKSSIEKFYKFYEKKLNFEKLDNTNVKVVECNADSIKTQSKVLFKKYINFKQDKVYKINFAEVDLSN